MSNDIKKRGLGRGLDALFREAKPENVSAPVVAPVTPAAAAAPMAPVKRADEMIATTPATSSAPAAAGVRKIGIQYLVPGGEFQPRRTFDEAALETLAESIRLHGILQPILVREKGANNYEIIAGERRWRAAQLVKLHEVPVIVKDLSDLHAMEIALIENLQREDLTPVEEAEGYQRLINTFGYTQDTLSKQLGKSRSHVTNMLRLLTLPASVRTLLDTGALTAGHARALVGAPKAEHLAGVIVKRGLSVRQTEQLVKSVTEGKKAAPGKKLFRQKDVDILALEQKITGILGLRVSITHGDKGGQIVVDYTSLDQLDDVVKRLTTTPKA